MHMTCAHCRADWCWICGQQLGDVTEHFAAWNLLGCPGYQFVDDSVANFGEIDCNCDVCCLRIETALCGCLEVSIDENGDAISPCSCMPSSASTGTLCFSIIKPFSVCYHAISKFFLFRLLRNIFSLRAWKMFTLFLLQATAISIVGSITIAMGLSVGLITFLVAYPIHWYKGHYGPAEKSLGLASGVVSGFVGLIMFFIWIGPALGLFCVGCPFLLVWSIASKDWSLLNLDTIGAFFVLPILAVMSFLVDDDD